MSGRLKSTLQGPGLHKRGRAQGDRAPDRGRGDRGRGDRGTGARPGLFDIEAVEAVEAAEAGLDVEPGLEGSVVTTAVRTAVVQQEEDEVAAEVEQVAAPGAAHRLGARLREGRDRLRARATSGLGALRQLRRPPRRTPPAPPVDGDETGDETGGKTGGHNDGGEGLDVSQVTGGVLLPSVEFWHHPAMQPPQPMQPMQAGAPVEHTEQEDETYAGASEANDRPPELALVSVDPAMPLEQEEPEEGEHDLPPTDGTVLWDAAADDAWLPVDPRIQERRLSVLREASRRRLQLTVAALSVLTAAVISILAVHSPLFGVRHLRVRGAVHTDLTLIARDAGVDSSTPMVDVNGSAIAAKLLRLPWVGTVRVSRVWPATVRIQITERTPVAFTPAASSTGARWALIDQTGRVLDLTDAAPPGLLRLTGVPAAGPPGSQLDAGADAALAVAASLPPDLTERLATVGPATKLRYDPDANLTLIGGGTVLWGPPDDAADKIVALRTVLNRVDLRHVATVDVRVPQAPTVRRP